MADLFKAATLANNCVGTNVDGNPLPRFTCKKTGATPVKTDCINMRLFNVSCPKINQSCNTLSNAYVAAVILCRQNIF